MTDPELEIVGESGDGNAAVRSITDLRPDLVFLDVQMPEIDGFDVLRAVPPAHAPRVVFVTAFDRYAVRAFDLHAVDYLLKPFKRSRLFEAVRRAKDNIRQQDESQAGKIADLLNQMDRDTRRLVVKSGGRILILQADEIEWVEAAANYVSVRTAGRDCLVRDTMNSFEKRLPENKFLRIHRSIIVNVDRIRELEPCNSGEYILTMRDGKQLPVGRSYRPAVESFLQLA